MAGVTNRLPVFPQREKNVLDAIFYQFIIRRKPAAIFEQIVIAKLHDSSKSVGVPFAEFIPPGQNSIVGKTMQSVNF
jgi:hypothetical protein